MRREDEDRLAEPYGCAVSDPERLAKALAIPVTRVRALQQGILVDLDPDALGIGWWKDHLATPQRILISDYLYACVDSIETNLVEARVHLLEARGAAAEQERKMAGSVRLDPSGRPIFKLPTPTCPRDELIGERIDMHIVGSVRALASALDCLGAVIIGVLALPEPILRAGYKSARAGIEMQEKEVAHPIQARCFEQIVDAIAAAGPAGWDEWVIAFRNMLVHRGRRMSMKKVLPTGSYLHAPDGHTVFSFNVIPMLPSDPARSDVEVMRDGSAQTLMLRENGWDTMEAALASTLFTVDSVAASLAQAWSDRRRDPGTLPQPAAQWPKPKKPQAVPFVGYAPETVPFDPTEMHVHSSFGRRMEAAALTDPKRRVWSDPSMQ